MTAQRLDTRGLICPLPVLKARKVLLSLPAGAQLEVLSSDVRAPKDFAEFCRENGYKLVSEKAENGVFSLLIQK